MHARAAAGSRQWWWQHRDRLMPAWLASAARTSPCFAQMHSADAQMLPTEKPAVPTYAARRPANCTAGRYSGRCCFLSSLRSEAARQRENSFISLCHCHLSARQMRVPVERPGPAFPLRSSRPRTKAKRALRSRAGANARIPVRGARVDIFRARSSGRAFQAAAGKRHRGRVRLSPAGNFYFNRNENEIRKKLTP